MWLRLLCHHNCRTTRPIFVRSAWIRPLTVSCSIVVICVRAWSVASCCPSARFVANMWSKWCVCSSASLSFTIFLFIFLFFFNNANYVYYKTICKISKNSLYYLKKANFCFRIPTLFFLFLSCLFLLFFYT